MNPGVQPAALKLRPVRDLLLLCAVFLIGFACLRSLRFNSSLLNYIFALRPIWQLGKLPRIIGLVLASPLLFLSLLLILASATCDFDLHPYTKDSCLQDLERIELSGYSVHLIQSGCGGVLVGSSLTIEQRKPIFPGLYLFRSVDFFDGAYEGQIRSVGVDKIYVHIPMGVQGSGWHQQIDRTYALKKHVYF
jgi:hypothetical protein